MKKGAFLRENGRVLRKKIFYKTQVKPVREGHWRDTIWRRISKPFLAILRHQRGEGKITDVRSTREVDNVPFYHIRASRA